MAFVQLLVDFSSLDKASVGKPVRDRKTEFKKEAEKKFISHAARDKTRDKILLRSRHSLKTKLRPQMFLTFTFHLFLFLRLTTKFSAILQLTVNIIETLLEKWINSFRCEWVEPGAPGSDCDLFHFNFIRLRVFNFTY